MVTITKNNTFAYSGNNIYINNILPSGHKK
jgi:hypothetical protein